MKGCLATLILTLFAVLGSGSVHAQDTTALTGFRSLNVFAEFSAARSGQGVGALWGGSAGGYLQGRFLGLMLRGTALPSNSAVRIYSAVLGPRLAVSLPIFRIFADAGGGMGHAGFYSYNGTFGTSWGPAWQVDVGLVRGLLPHLDWHPVELSYSHIYAGPGVSPEMISTGFALHL